MTSKIRLILDQTILTLMCYSLAPETLSALGHVRVFLVSSHRLVLIHTQCTCTPSMSPLPYTPCVLCTAEFAGNTEQNACTRCSDSTVPRSFQTFRFPSVYKRIIVENNLHPDHPMCSVNLRVWEFLIATVSKFAKPPYFYYENTQTLCPLFYENTLRALCLLFYENTLMRCVCRSMRTHRRCVCRSVRTR